MDHFTKKIRVLSIAQLQRLKAKKEAAVKKMIGAFYRPRIVGGEIAQIERELQRRQPKTVHYTVVMDDLHHGSGIWFYFLKADDTRRRVHPRKPQGATSYPQDLTADEIDVWMRRTGITHVFADTEDSQTTSECLARGKYTRARFVAWWRQLEQDAR